MLDNKIVSSITCDHLVHVYVLTQLVAPITYICLLWNWHTVCPIVLLV